MVNHLGKFAPREQNSRNPLCLLKSLVQYEVNALPHTTNYTMHSDELYHAIVVSIYKLTASSFITAISAVTSSVTAIRGADTLTIGAPKCSTLTRSCTNCNTDVKMLNAWKPKLYS